MAITVIAPQSKTKPFTKNSVYYTLKFFFILLLFAGYLPVQGLFSTANHLRFNFFSWQFIHSLYIVVIACIMNSLRVYHHFVTENKKITLRKKLRNINCITSSETVTLRIKMPAKQFPSE